MKSGEGSSCFLPRSYNLSSSSHRSSVQMLSVFWPFYSLYKKMTPQTLLSFTNVLKQSFLYFRHCVRMGLPHANPPLPCILYLYAISDGHAGHLDTGLRLRNPAIVHPVLIIRCCFISEQSLSLDQHFTSCTSCRNCFIPSISGGETMASSYTNPGTDAQTKLTVTTMLC